MIRTSHAARKSGWHGQYRTATLQVYRLYKAIVSPVLHALTPTRCAYLPTCSEYAYVAVHRFGIVRGGLLALRRLLRCHPWAEGGLDPVPLTTSAGHTKKNHLP